MGSIKLLTPSVYNKIAAGEVVERPYGAVKELVENSIDSGATRIVIEVTKGGLELISVSDNGYGISADDVDLAFLNHATSKLQSAENLRAIDTLGFRGEALSSIAAVSKITLTTRTRNAETATKVYVEDGKVSDKQFVATNFGTKIEVIDLFYNMPARKKFLKSCTAENAEITKFVSKLILTNSTLEITYISDGKTVYSTKGNGLEEAIFAIYGTDFLANCIKVDYARENMRIEGYIGSPELTKSNKNFQTLSVNHRYVADQGISGAIAQAYKNYLMTRQFPVYILDLYIPSDMVDVNVHPKKSEVRFFDSRKVCGAFYNCVSNALNNYTEQRSNEIFARQQSESDSPKYSQEDFITVFNRLAEEDRLDCMNRDQTAAVNAMEKSTEEADRKKSLSELGALLEREVTVEKARANLGWDNQDQVKHPDALIIQPQTTTYIPSEEDLLFDKAKILGVAFKTYLILEIDDKVIFVDQHAAHERLLFDNFMQNRTNDMQAVIPYVFSVSDEEALFIEENRQDILSAGIEVENFGRNTFRITAISTLLTDLQMQDFVKFLLSSIEEFKIDDHALIVEKIAKKACKAAVKAGYALNEYEIKYILKQVCDNQILQCPHGRPITVIFTKAQIEKLFKRIV